MIGNAGPRPTSREIVQRLVDACQPERIYLFGSRARGDGGADSDYDIMVVVAQSTNPVSARSARAQPAWDLGAAPTYWSGRADAFDSRVHLARLAPCHPSPGKAGMLYVA